MSGADPAPTTTDESVTDPDRRQPVEPVETVQAVEPAGPPPTTRGERIGLVVGVVALAVAVVGTRWGVFTPDTRPDLYAQPGRFLRQCFEAWVGGATGLGQGNFNSGSAPVAAVVWLIRALGAPAWLAVRVWRLLLLVLAAWGIRRYLGVVVGDRLTPLARFVATVFWVVNPYVIVAGNTTPILLPYALLPWTLVAFVHAGRHGGWRWPAVFALAFFAQSGLNAGVVPFFGLVALPAHLVYLRLVEGRAWRPLLAALGRCGVLSVVVSIYWLAPSYVAAGTGASIASSTEAPADVARTSSYAETARGLGHWALYGRAGDRLFLGGYTIYLTNPFVILATYGLTAAMGLVLWRSRSRVRLLAIGLIVTALPIMVGLFPGLRPYPAGRVLEAIFDRVPASLAFRTTNKVGAVVFLGFALLVAVGVHRLQSTLHGRGRIARVVSVAIVVLLLTGASAPLWNGSLYPVGHNVPQRWLDAMADLDARGTGRVLVVPGGTGGNYRWGMQSPDDIFPSYLRRPVVTRSTVVGAADPTGNFLTNVDTQLQQGVLASSGVSTISRYLGADAVIDRNDVYSEENLGANPSVVAGALAADTGLHLEATYGAVGTDTVPGRRGPVTAAGRRSSPADAALHPIEVYSVVSAQQPEVVSASSSLVLVDGDGAAFSPLIDAGILDGTQPVRYLGDLDRTELRDALEGGARVVLTDTNQRRAWDINRLLDASSGVLPADGSLDEGAGPSITLWPDDPDRQSVAELGDQIRSVTASARQFGVRPWIKPSFAIDDDDSTTWWTGGTFEKLGELDVRLTKPIDIASLSIKVPATEPARISQLEVTVGARRVRVPVPAGSDWVDVKIPTIRSDRLHLAITGVTPGANAVGISEIEINDRSVTGIDRIRLPRTLEVLANGDDGLRRDLEQAPLDVVMSRLRGRLDSATDDEESVLNRRFELPIAREFTFSARLDATDISPVVLAEAQAGRARCQPVASIDGTPVTARITALDDTGPTGAVVLEGCSPLDLAAGSHELDAFFGWRLNRVQLQTTVERATSASDGPTIVPAAVVESTATRLELDVPAGTGDRYLRLGIAYDPRWTITVDGASGPDPIVVDGYSIGWRLDGDAHHVVVSFPPQRAVEGAAVLSAAGIVAVTSIAVLPTPPAWRRRPEGDDGDPDGTDGAEGDER